MAGVVSCFEGAEGGEYGLVYLATGIMGLAAGLWCMLKAFAAGAFPQKKFCPKCGQPSPNEAELCRSCGASLPAGIREPLSSSHSFFKPGNKRCPNCGRHQGWYRSWGPWPLQFYPYKWNCAECQTSLRYDMGRYLAVVWLAIAPLLLIGESLAETRWIWAAFILIFPLAFLGKWWAASIRRVEEPLPRTQKVNPKG